MRCILNSETGIGLLGLGRWRKWSAKARGLITGKMRKFMNVRYRTDGIV